MSPVTLTVKIATHFFFFFYHIAAGGGGGGGPQAVACTLDVLSFHTYMLVIFHT